MRDHQVQVRLLSALLAAAALSAPAAAKVAFTGYGSFTFTPEGTFQIYGPASVIGTLPEGPTRIRAFALDSVGLFATTKVGEDSDFLMDLNFRSIGATVGELRVQYAYLDTGLPWEARLKAGKVTLPLGYLNTRRFYPFQRVELSPPTFVSGILGLPIADIGGIVSRRFPAGDYGLDMKVFGVNGYGSIPGSTGTFRSAGTPGGLGIARNLGSANNNRDLAVGGQLALNKGGTDDELGASYYRGAWDPSGDRLLQIAMAHLHLTPEKFDILAEYLHMNVTGDEGMFKSFGRPDWHTDGGFLDVSRPVGSVAGKPLLGYGRGEAYFSGANDGSGGHEIMRVLAGGLNLRVNESIVWKGELLWLEYRVPLAAAKSVVLAGHTAQLGLVITF